MPRTARIAALLPLIAVWIASPAVALAAETDAATAAWAAGQRPTFLAFYGIMVVVVFAVTGTWAHRPEALGTTGPRMVLFVAALPPATLLAATYGPRFGLGAFLFGAIVLTGISEGIGRGLAVRALAALSLIEVALVIADQALGAPLSAITMFGYDPVASPRAYGLGNEMAGLAVGATLVAGAMLVEGWPDAPWRGAVRTWGFPVLAAAVIGVASAPRLGANAGVVIWATVMLGVAWWGMLGKRLDLRFWAALAGIVVVAAAAIVALDVAGGANTHIGKAWLSLVAGDFGALGAILTSKLRIAWGILTSSWLMVFPVAIVAGLAWVRLRPGATMRAAFERFPAVRAVLDGFLIGVPVVLLSEDSGIVIPALAAVYVGAAVVLAAVRAAEEAGA